ncbi:MAG: acetyl-CoA decarbonylase/synthase complex subunit gamma [Candidatus Eremiobacteraeota bacterium]|nr:acetyl-CoA decarbonylase/synthase complex subunit gamma [Candidatus Eremiobacteraeota bacterium]
MASGMGIFKLLPKTNCRDCGSPSCLAFAMKVAAGKVEYEKCPHISTESQKKLEELMEPPLRNVMIKRGNKIISLGGEKVLFRHDESFYSPTALAVLYKGDNSGDNMRKWTGQLENLTFERAGEKLAPDMIAFEDNGCEIGETSRLIQSLFELTELPLIIKTGREKLIESLLDINPFPANVVYLTLNNPDNILSRLSGKNITAALPVHDIDDARNVGDYLLKRGIKNAVFAVEADSPADQLDLLTSLRRCALVSRERRLGFPTLVWRTLEDENPASVCTAIIKYGSMAIVSTTDPDVVLPYLTLRHNIFTDPRRPVQVEAKLNKFGDVTTDSPVFITTNFSLTYFTVAQEIEASRVPSYLLIVDTDGTSVLTAWAADRFNSGRILEMLKSEKVEDLISHREIIIPGYVASLKEEIEQSSSWEVTVGPREAAGIPGFLSRKIKEKRKV